MDSTATFFIVRMTCISEGLAFKLLRLHLSIRRGKSHHRKSFLKAQTGRAHSGKPDNVVTVDLILLE